MFILKTKRIKAFEIKEKSLSSEKKFLSVAEISFIIVEGIFTKTYLYNRKCTICLKLNFSRSQLKIIIFNS